MTKKDLELVKESKELQVKFFHDNVTGKNFTVDKYPANQVTKDSAHYAVSEEYGKFIGKTRTLAGAKNMIREHRKLRSMV